VDNIKYGVKLIPSMAHKYVLPVFAQLPVFAAGRFSEYMKYFFIQTRLKFGLTLHLPAKILLYQLLLVL
jgi:hypothetical protein